MSQPGESPYVIIVGGGKLGFHLAKHLIDRDFEVTVIEKDPVRAEWIEHHLGPDTVMVGDGDEMAFLATTGIERARFVVGVTGDDEDNLIACQLAKVKFNVPRTIARVNNPGNVQVFKALGIDVAVSATELLMGLIEAELGGADTVRGVAVRSSGAAFVDLALPDVSDKIGKRLADISLPEGDMVVCVVRAGKPVIPRPDLLVEPNDELIIYSQLLDVEAMRETLAGS
ncbi:MAG TPA: NAD-binding protein [Candidatus Binatia bacterium]|nr:NAD-binding protein [Candidatus Binatia bacterium]